MKKSYATNRTLRDKPKFDKPNTRFITSIAILLYLAVVIFFFTASVLANDQQLYGWKARGIIEKVSIVSLFAILIMTSFLIAAEIFWYRIDVEVEHRFKTLAIEVVKFVPVIFAIGIFNLIWEHLLGFMPSNVKSIQEAMINNQISISIWGMLVAPIYEEFLFRFAPSRFISNKKVFIIVASVIFAVIHIDSDPNILFSLPEYLPISIYITYRYAVTENIWVAIALHITNNTVAFLI